MGYYTNFNELITQPPPGPLSLIGTGYRVPMSIYNNNLNNVRYVSTVGQLGAATIDSMTTRSRQRTPARYGCTDLQVIYQNYYSAGLGEVTAGGTITMDACLEYPVNVFTPLIFGGNGTAFISVNTTVVSDPLRVNIPANTYYWIRTYANVPAPSQVSVGIPTGTGFTGVDPLGVDATLCGDNRLSTGTGTDQSITSGTAWITTTTTPTYQPISVVGTTNAPQLPFPIVGTIGDSIIDGTGDAGNTFGYARRALVAADIAYYHFGCPSEAAYNFSNYNQRYWIGANYNRMQRAPQCTSFIYDYGANDLAYSRTFANTRTAVLWSVQELAYHGAVIWLCTLIPRTTSTDSWATTANQTAVAQPVRAAYNAWVRAPASAGVGNSAAADFAAQNTPLGGIIDLAQPVETVLANTPPAPGVLLSGASLWYVTTPQYTLDGTHPNAPAIPLLQALVPVAQFV